MSPCDGVDHGEGGWGEKRGFAGILAHILIVMNDISLSRVF